jgi:hypothetical protein
MFLACCARFSVFFHLDNIHIVYMGCDWAHRHFDGAQFDQLTIIDDVLVRQLEGLNTKLQVIVPMTERRTILSHYHDNRTSAHLGLRKTLAKIRQGYYWLFPPLVSGNSQRMSIAMRSIGNPVSTICIGALFFLFGGFFCEQNEQPATYNLTSFCKPGQ